jgi:hypothetical protein
MTGRIEVSYKHDPRCPAYRDDTLTRGSVPRPSLPGECSCGHPGPIALAAARQLATEALAATPGQPVLTQKAG